VSNGGPPNPREQKARAEFALKQHQGRQRQFAQDLATGKTGLVDRIGQAVEIKALILWKIPPQFDLIWTVEDIVPSLNPQHAVGMLNVKLTCTIPLLAPAGQRQMTFVRCGHEGDNEEKQVEKPQIVTGTDGGEQELGPRPVDIEGDVEPPPPVDDPPE
jgi:hypothetical protein